MNKYEYWNKCCELLEQANEKEAKLEAYVQKWLSGEGVLSSETMEQTIITVNDQISQIRSEAEKFKLEFDRLSKEEKLQQEQLESSKTTGMRLRYQLGVDTDKMVITGGVLSSNASESHLIGRDKTAEELEIDKQVALTTLRERVAKKEVSLSEASQLKNDIENYYGKNNEMSSSRHM
ncbi:MAG: hypothetical protein PUB18_03785 [bacterium]|nr:hypothetical protein [bacterium]